MRGVFYPFRADSTIARSMEVGASLTPAKEGLLDSLHARRFKANILTPPVSLPGNQIQGFRRTSSPSGQAAVRVNFRETYR